MLDTIFEKYETQDKQVTLNVRSAESLREPAPRLTGMNSPAIKITENKEFVFSRLVGKQLKPLNLASMPERSEVDEEVFFDHKRMLLEHL